MSGGQGASPSRPPDNLRRGRRLRVDELLSLPPIRIGPLAHLLRPRRRHMNGKGDAARFCSGPPSPSFQEDKGPLTPTPHPLRPRPRRRFLPLRTEEQKRKPQPQRLPSLHHHPALLPPRGTRSDRTDSPPSAHTPARCRLHPLFVFAVKLPPMAGISGAPLSARVVGKRGRQAPRVPRCFVADRPLRTRPAQSAVADRSVHFLLKRVARLQPGPVAAYT